MFWAARTTAVNLLHARSFRAEGRAGVFHILSFYLSDEAGNSVHRNPKPRPLRPGAKPVSLSPNRTCPRARSSAARRWWSAACPAPSRPLATTTTCRPSSPTPTSSRSVSPSGGLVFRLSPPLPVAAAAAAAAAAFVGVGCVFVASAFEAPVFRLCCMSSALLLLLVLRGCSFEWSAAFEVGRWKHPQVAGTGGAWTPCCLKSHDAAAVLR